MNFLKHKALLKIRRAFFHSIVSSILWPLVYFVVLSPSAKQKLRTEYNVLARRCVGIENQAELDLVFNILGVEPLFELFDRLISRKMVSWDARSCFLTWHEVRPNDYLQNLYLRKESKFKTRPEHRYPTRAKYTLHEILDNYNLPTLSEKLAEIKEKACIDSALSSFPWRSYDDAKEVFASAETLSALKPIISKAIESTHLEANKTAMVKNSFYAKNFSETAKVEALEPKARRLYNKQSVTDENWLIECIKTLR